MKQLITALLICSAGAVFAQKKTDFTGNFKVNEEKVNWGPAPKYILPRFIKVTQLKDKIIIARTPLDRELKEQAPVIDTIGFGGKPVVKTSASGSKLTWTLQWTNDTSFVLVRSSEGANGQSSKTTETWSLQDGGKTLFIDRDVESSIKYNTKAYFDKQ